jgi:hypothetical protein
LVDFKSKQKACEKMAEFVDDHDEAEDQHSGQDA